jgi:hypothetical protein
MSHSWIKTAAVLAAPVLGLAGFAAQSDAALIYGLSENNNIFRFDSNNPEIIQSGVFVQGLAGAELLNIDFRPATGQLVGLTTDNRIVNINPDTGVAVTTGVLSVPLNGTTFAFDFNPTVDRIRVVSDTGQNLRVNPDTGIVTVDSPINPSGRVIVGAAYTNSFPGATTTTLYTIDSLSDSLYMQNPPNNGTQVLVGSLDTDGQTIDTTNRVGFDIGPGNEAFAALNETPISVSDLYTINLQTGAIEFAGQIGGGLFVRDIAVVVPEPGTLGLLAVGALLAVRRRRA